MIELTHKQHLFYFFLITISHRICDLFLLYIIIICSNSSSSKITKFLNYITTNTHINMSSHAMNELTQKAQIDLNLQNMHYPYSAQYFLCTAKS